MTQHYRVSPSALARHMVCPASFTEEAKYPDQPSGPAAIDGTHTHTLIEHCINDGLKDPMLTIGQTLADHEGEFEVDFERAKRATVMIEHVKRRKEEMGVVAIRAESTANPGAYLGWDDWRGTADVTIVGDTVLDVIDYKDGRTRQTPENNPQLMSYALGRLLEYQNQDGTYPFDAIRMTIVQPRCDPPITHHGLSPEDLFSFAQEVKAWREVAEGENPPFVPGESQCRWCNARGGCSALTHKALERVAMQFQNIEVAQQAADKEPTQMSDQQIAEFIEAIPLLKQTIIAVEEEAMRRFESGHEIPGLKVVRGKGQRKWRYDESVVAAKLKKMQVPKGSMYVTKLVSPAQAEKLNWEKRDGTRKTLSQRQLKVLHEEMIEKGEGKLTVVPQSDERESVHIGVKNLFAPVESEPELPAWLTGE